jgi:hypothetical protein
MTHSSVTTIIHTLHGGPVLHLQAAKPFRFEDHRHLGPIIVDRHGKPSSDQPDELSTFWTHYEAWCRQGKKTQLIGDQRWCVYQTDMQRAREAHAARRKATTPVA